jgi:hypothetical protein
VVTDQDWREFGMTKRRLDVAATMLALAAVEVLLFAAVIMTAVGPQGGSAERFEAGSPVPGSPVPIPSQVEGGAAR